MSSDLLYNSESNISPHIHLAAKNKKIANQKTLDDYYAFFSGQDVDMLPYVYAELSDAYNDLVHTPDYYLFKDEVNTIIHNKDKLAKHLAGVTDIIEIGPGCDYTVENKTIPILNCTESLKRYYAVDYSESYLLDACNSVKKYKFGIDVLSINADLMKGKIGLEGVLKGKKCVLFLGSTLGNFIDFQQQYAINQISLITNPGDLLTLTADSNLDGESVLKSYSNSSFYIFAMNALRHFATIYSPFKDYLSSFEVECIWNESSHSNEAYFIAKDDLSFKFSNFDTINIKQGQKLRGIKSRKFSELEIAKILQNTFDIIDDLSYSGRARVFICKRI